MFLLALCLLQLLWLTPSASGESGSSPELSLSVVFLRGDCGETAAQVTEEAARMAARDVSDCSSIVSPVLLTPTAPPTNSAADGELDVLLEEVQSGLLDSSVQTMAVVYPGCSESLGVLADVLSSRVFQIPLFSFIFPYSPSHTTTSTYHTRMTQDEATLSPAIATIITQFGWQRVALLSEATPAFNQIHQDLLRDLEESAVSVHHQAILDSAPKLLPPDTRTLFGEDVKVFVLNMNMVLSRAVLCQALHTLAFPGYVWITHGWFEEGWWEAGEEGGEEESLSSCTDEELAAYLERSLALSHYPSWQGDMGSGAGASQPACLKSGPELTRELLRLAPPTDPQSALPASVYLVYDSVWAAALAYITAPLSLYPDTINTVTFRGASGSVSFINGSRELLHLTLSQYRKVSDKLQRVTVSSLTPLEGGSQYNLTYNEGENPATVWPDGPPPDGTPVQVEHFPYPALMGVVYTYSLLGVLFALACLTFNLVFRKRKLIKLSSPNLNSIIVLGAIVSYLAGLTFFYPQGASTTGIIWGCNLRAWTVALGFSACYGTLNVKMWRVYSICRNPRPSMSKTMIKDYHLMLLVLGFVMVDTVLLVVVMSLDNSRFTVTTIPNKQDPTPRVNEEGIKEVSVVSRCLSTTEPYWISILFGYKAVIQAIGLYLAFKIRNIKIRGLNDSREVSITLYVTSVILLVIMVTSFVYGDYIDVDGFVYGFGLSTAVTVVLSLTFIPKMVGLYRDPEGKDIFSDPTTTDGSPGSEIHYLQRRVRELEKQVELARSQENLLDINTSKAPPIAPPPSLSLATATPSNTSDSVPSSRVRLPSE